MRLAWSLFCLIFSGLVLLSEPMGPDAPGSFVKLAETSPAKIVEASPFPPAQVDASAPLGLSQDRFRWFKVTSYTGAITWEVDAEGVIGRQEFAKAGQLFGTVEGSSEPSFSDIVEGAVVVWRKTDGLVKLSAYGVVNGKAKKLDTIRIKTGSGPIPNPTPIDDQTTSAVKSAFLSDTDTDKASAAANLAAFYRGAARDYTTDAKVKTWADFAFAMQDGRNRVIGDKIPKTRAALLANVFSAWPTSGTFDSSARATATAALTQAAKILEGIK